MPRRKRCQSFFEVIDEELSNDSVPVQRNAANARERARMRVLSCAFGRLKTKLPNIPADTKLSKLDTLRLATIYIRQLKTAIEEQKDEKQTSLLTPAINVNLQTFSNDRLSWPYGWPSCVVDAKVNCTESNAVQSSTLTNSSIDTSIDPLQRVELWSSTNNIGSCNNQDNLLNVSSRNSDFTNSSPLFTENRQNWSTDKNFGSTRIDFNSNWNSDNILSNSYNNHQERCYDPQHSSYNCSQPSLYYDQHYQNSLYEQQHFPHQQEQYLSPLTTALSSPSSFSSSSSTILSSVYSPNKDNSKTLSQDFSKANNQYISSNAYLNQ